MIAGFTLTLFLQLGRGTDSSVPESNATNAASLSLQNSGVRDLDSCEAVRLDVIQLSWEGYAVMNMA